MTKKKFLDLIQNKARLSERVAKVWNVAIKIDENDARWAKVESHPDENIVIDNFEVVFGMREQVEQVDENALLIKKAERELEKAKEKLAKLESKGAELDLIESQKKLIAHLENSLKVLKR